MMWFCRISFIFVLSVFAVACTSSDESQEAAVSKEKLPPPEFTQTDDAQTFVNHYLNDLESERFLPTELVQELTGSTSLKHAKAMIDKHDTLDFINWYFSETYLTKVKNLVDRKVKRLDYQLNILEVSKEDASDVLLVIESSPLSHRIAIQEGGKFQQSWQSLNDDEYSLILANSKNSIQLRVLKEQGFWKLESPHF